MKISWSVWNFAKISTSASKLSVHVAVAWGGGVDGCMFNLFSWGMDIRFREWFHTPIGWFWLIAGPQMQSGVIVFTEIFSSCPWIVSDMIMVGNWKKTLTIFENTLFWMWVLDAKLKIISYFRQWNMVEVMCGIYYTRCSKITSEISVFFSEHLILCAWGNISSNSPFSWKNLVIEWKWPHRSTRV